jgi:carbamoyltransferase
MSKPIYVLGTNLSHNGSSCLLRDGEIAFAIEKERLTRRKHDGYNDSLSIEYCLNAEGIKFRDLSLVVQNTWEGMFERGADWYDGPRCLDPAVPLVTISHHLAHAYGAFATSPFDEADVLVIDNGGNSFDECQDLHAANVPLTPPHDLEALYCETDSFYHFGPTGVLTLFKDFSPPGLSRKPYCMLPRPLMHSIGGLYLAVSTYIFSGMEDPGKLMGLAPYGRSGIHKMPMFDLQGGRVFVRYDWQQHFNEPCRDYEQFKRSFQYYADIAYWTQKEVESAILYLVTERLSLGKSRNLCYAGGVALNAVANGLIRQLPQLDDLYIQPAAGDNGIAIGCAYYGWMQVLKRERKKHDGSPFLGRSYSANAGRDSISKLNAERYVRPSGDYICDTAQFLSMGKTVGWFQGGGEFGPRALGNRSILADPRRAGLRDRINSQIKKREDFRPFAPSVIREDVGLYFEFEGDSPYMTLVAPVRSEWCERLPNVVHQDGSARIQTVTESANPLYFKLLIAFRDQTGVGVLLNTSLNRRGQPIVETPTEAVELFLASALDVLVLDGCMLVKPDE